MNLTTLTPSDAARLVPALAERGAPAMWVYRCQDAGTGWTLSVATHAEPGSGKLSLGGFRIAPAARMASPGFSTEREAIQLAMGMEEKVRWSRVVGAGGPLARRDLSRIVGGKCVISPTDDARVGEARDTELLDFSIECFSAIEAAGGFHIATGQDLGHGIMHDGSTESLRYLHERFTGSAVADTSVPTGEGNVRLLTGMLRALDIDVARATVGLLGCGHVGMHVFRRLRELGTDLLVLDGWSVRREELLALGVAVWSLEDKDAFLSQPMDAVVVNAAGGSLDGEAIDAICANGRLSVVCGSENLAMPEPHLAFLLRDNEKLYAPTELGGMMGYLTAAEEYLAGEAGVPFDVGTLLDAAGRLEEAGHEAALRVRQGGYRETFEDAVLSRAAR